MSQVDTPMWLAEVARLVVPTAMQHEGLSLKVYRDPKGIRTVGYGCNLEAPGAKKVCAQAGVNYVGLMVGSVELTQAQAMDILTLQMFAVIEEAMTVFPGFLGFPDKVKIVVCDLIFNLGLGGFSEFRHFIDAVRRGEWKDAAGELRDSKWARQVGGRAEDDCAMLEGI